MRIDATHRGWFIASVMIALAGGLGYGVYAATIMEGPRGGTWVGLMFGLLASSMVLFAGLLAVRKKTLLVRFGSATWWMRGHLWLGLLSLPMAFYHSAFRFGGSLTTVLMWLLLIVVISGVVGAILQHALPGVMTAQVVEERTYEQLERMRLQRRRSAYECVAAACGELDEAGEERARLEAALGDAPHVPKAVKAVEGAHVLKELYLTAVLPYLRALRGRDSALTRPTHAMLLFEEVRTRVDPALHASVAAMAAVCEEHRQQIRQGRIHRVLHGWLLLHIPASAALVVLLLVHAAMALYY